MELSLNDDVNWIAGYSIDDSSSEEIWGSSKEKGNGNGTDVGLTPPVFNLARHASILSNGTCGENGDETYCKLTEHVHDRPPRPSQCQVCSADSPVSALYFLLTLFASRPGD